MFSKLIIVIAFIWVQAIHAEDAPPSKLLSCGNFLENMRALDEFTEEDYSRGCFDAIEVARNNCLKESAKSINVRIFKRYGTEVQKMEKTNAGIHEQSVASSRFYIISNQTAVNKAHYCIEASNKINHACGQDELDVESQIESKTRFAQSSHDELSNLPLEDETRGAIFAAASKNKEDLESLAAQQSALSGLKAAASSAVGDQLTCFNAETALINDLSVNKKSATLLTRSMHSDDTNVEEGHDHDAEKYVFQNLVNDTAAATSSYSIARAVAQYAPSLASSAETAESLTPAAMAGANILAGDVGGGILSAIQVAGEKAGSAAVAVSAVGGTTFLGYMLYSSPTSQCDQPSSLLIDPVAFIQSGCNLSTYVGAATNEAAINTLGAQK